MKLGLHVAVGDGYAKAVEYAKSIGATAIQFFAGNPKAFKTGPVDVPALETFCDLRRAAGITSSVIHTSYLINLASAETRTVGSSKHLIEKDLEVAAAGGVDFVNTHLGSYGTRDRAEGFASVVTALERVLMKIRPGVMLILENSAGAGNLCGGTVEELGAFMRAVDHPQLGVCIDTAHAWAAGYEINSGEGVDRFLDLVDREVSLDRLKMFHFNDTQIALGGHRDRHWHIGEGLVGRDGFAALLARREVRERTVILETPGEEADDLRNLTLTRSLYDLGVAIP